ncbi:TIGR03960 family B12-binding radical SAM protein [Desulfovibrio sp. OttesenSCG-928-M16]|nr:TIGR03960 family B12-binding radical SAM protein [Desulfovibrio sp. OttesenSCG-928-M16]
MRELLSLLPKPSRYLGIEEGSIHKDFQDISLRVGLAFPDLYEVGMSYLGQKILYAIINEREDWQAERVFAPCREAGAVLREHGAPLCTLESDRPLADLDVLGFSVTHELCYSNILYMLDLAGIPLKSAERAQARSNGRPWPLVMAGGGCTLSAEALAPFMDVMILGEGEEAAPELLTVFQGARKQGLGREALLAKLATVPGVYVPEFFTSDTQGLCQALPGRPQSVTRRVVADLDAAPYPAVQPIPFGAVHNRLALEIARGCTRGCRFCQAGILYRPARERSVPRLRTMIEDCLNSTGFDDMSFLSLSTGDYSALRELFMGAAERCAAEQVSLSLPSLRVGSIDDAVMGRLAGIRRTGATLAPEAGSQRLRDVINKGVTEEDLILHVQKLFEHGWQQVKLYFMIGLPTETDDDLLAIIDLCRKARDAAGPGIKRLQITAALSPFVPKAHTPFQWEAQISPAEMRRRITLLLNAVRGEKRIKLRWHEADMSLLEGIFSRADRRLAPVLESAYRKGAIFSSWIENFSLEPWLQALAEQGLSPEDFTRSRSPDEALPWDHLRSGVSREHLLRERDRAFAGAVSGDCRYAACRECGVCDSKAGPSLLEGAPDREAGFFRNRLNRPARDQEAHSVRLDEYGRVIVRGAEETALRGKAKPKGTEPHLAVKVCRLRFIYSCKGAAAYLSQLELQKIFDRAMRRAALPLSFSQGFHPLPLVSFGRALPVGVASEGEAFSACLRARASLPELLEAMNRGLPRGLRILSVEERPLEDKLLDQQLEHYRIECRDAQRAGDFCAAWTRVEAAKTLPWLREGKKGSRELDARAPFRDIALQSDTSCLLCLDWTQGYVSPLALCIFALEAAGFVCGPELIALTKLAQEKICVNLPS